MLIPVEQGKKTPVSNTENLIVLFWFHFARLIRISSNKPVSIISRKFLLASDKTELIRSYFFLFCLRSIPN